MDSTVDRSLSRASRMLLLVGTLFIAGYTLSGLFVSIFIWKVEHSFVDIGLFHLAMYSCLSLSFLLAGYLSPRCGELWMIRLGVLGVSIFFFLLLLIGEKSSHFVVGLGMFFGVGQGLYWYGYHVLTFDLTHDVNRSSFNGWAGLLGTLAGTIGPFLASFLIIEGSRFSGYHLIFGISLALFALLFVLSFRIKHDHMRKPLRLQEGFRVRRDPDWRNLLIGQTVFGLREGMFAFLIGLLVFFVTKSEVGLGEYGLWTGLLSLVGFYVAGKLAVHHRASHRVMRVAGILLALGAQVFLWEVSRRSLIVFGVITACSLPFMVLPLGVMQMNEIDETAQTAQYRSEHLIARELALGFGRVVSLIIYTLVAAYYRTESALILLVSLLGCAHAVVVWIVRDVRYEPSGERTSDEGENGAKQKAVST